MVLLFVVVHNFFYFFIVSQTNFFVKYSFLQSDTKGSFPDEFPNESVPTGGSLLFREFLRYNEMERLPSIFPTTRHDPLKQEALL